MKSKGEAGLPIPTAQGARAFGEYLRSRMPRRLARREYSRKMSLEEVREGVKFVGRGARDIRELDDDPSFQALATKIQSRLNGIRRDLGTLRYWAERPQKEAT